MRASLGVRFGPLYVGTGNLLRTPRRTPRRRGPNLWTWLVLFPFLLMWWTVKLLVLAAPLVWAACAWAVRQGRR